MDTRASIDASVRTKDAMDLFGQFAIEEKAAQSPAPADLNASKDIPRVINVEKNAAYPRPLQTSKPVQCFLRQLNFDKSNT